MVVGAAAAAVADADDCETNFVGVMPSIDNSEAELSVMEDDLCGLALW